MTKPVEVSVVIPAYNEEGYIGRLLADLAAQSFKNIEVIVADALSTDNTVDVIHSFTDKLDIKIVEAPPKNPGAGRNAGVKVARGDWLLFLDADDHTDDLDFIKTMLTKTEAKGWKTSSARFEVEKGPFSQRVGFKFYYAYLKFLSHTKHPIAPGACIFTSRDMFNRHGGFNEKITFGEDNDYVTRSAGSGFGFIGETYYYIDMRRYEEEKSSFILKSVHNELHRLTHGFKLDTSPHEYEFGKHHQKQ
ncbi:MAG TPA: glycosyltransferase [Candidatus Saccharimonadales bacterium]|nr:glycosyltransferase [Candidatus Saccharimonadales bacterium]